MSAYHVVVSTNTALRHYPAESLREALRLRKVLFLLWCTDQPNIEVIRRDLLEEARR